jgi:hypothetical protein
LGHEDQFTPLTLSDRCSFGQATFAKMLGNGRNAPRAVVGLIDKCLPESGSCLQPNSGLVLISKYER